MIINSILEKSKVIPVVVLDDLDNSLRLAEIFISTGIRVIEVTLRTPIALECITAIKKNFPDITVGAGTIKNSVDAKRAIDSGSEFLVSPGLSLSISKITKENEIPFLPGVATSTEIIQALDNGFYTLKFFPAMLAGGIGMLKAWKEVFPEVNFCPTGGVNITNLNDFIQLDNVLCVGGSWIAPRSKIIEKDWKYINTMCLELSSLLA